MPTCRTVAALAELFALEAAVAPREWDDMLRLEANGCRSDSIHWPMAAALLLGLVLRGARDLSQARLTDRQIKDITTSSDNITTTTVLTTVVFSGKGCHQQVVT